MENLIKKGIRTIIGFNGKWGESAGRVEFSKTKNGAAIIRQQLMFSFENVYVFDTDGDFIDPCEL